MSQPDYDRAVERIATDSAFADAVRANPAAALAEYELTDSERENLLGLRSEAPGATAGAAPVALATRRSKTSFLGIGAVGAVAAAGAAFGIVHYAVPSYARSMTLDAGPSYSINTVAMDSSGDIAIHSTLAPGPHFQGKLIVNKPVDALSPLIRADAVTGKPISASSVLVKKNGTDWLLYQGSNCRVASDSASAISSSNAPTEDVTLECSTLIVSYPNGGP
ncbi:MAG TPA: hypothetical protein VGR61_10565 [Candidatus Dormibacteraeota bacterium]|nr:hypothetical protein [Candidatus Dormibacteraeota bacterium]